MYADNQRRSASQRVNDEFLRRMMGGNLTPSPKAERSEQPTASACAICSQGCERNDRPNMTDSCPTTLHAPSLAMVYSPRQCWRNVLSPEEGLKKGSIFEELVLPLEADGRGGINCRGTEVRTRK